MVPYADMELAELRAQLLHRTGRCSRSAKPRVILLLEAYDLVQPRVRSVASGPVILGTTPTPAEEDFGALTMDTLKARLRAAGLAVGGRKAELVARLEHAADR